MRERAFVREVGLRDGLQLVRSPLPTENKIAWIQREAAAGVAEIEVTSFVPGRTFPQFADAEAIVAAALEDGRFTASGLVVNEKGADRAFRSGLGSINYVVSASEAHSRANVGRSTSEACAILREMCQRRSGEKPIRIACGIATAFGCSLQGEVASGTVLDLAETILECGVDEIFLADTVGYASPLMVRERFAALMAMIPANVAVGAHFHDTRGLGLANVLAACEAGVRRFDASLGGLGGCPFAPGATGNIDTEDCAFLLASLGFETGIDLDRLLAVRADLGGWLPNERLSGALFKAGLPRR